MQNDYRVYQADKPDPILNIDDALLYMRKLDDWIGRLLYDYDNSNVQDEFIWRFFVNYGRHNNGTFLTKGADRDKTQQYELISSSFNSSFYMFTVVENSGQHIGYSVPLNEVIEFIKEMYERTSYAAVKMECE